jgi:DNA-binding NarL/FixJ family response regulator
MNETPSQVKRAMAAGARGYITEGEARDIARAVRSALDGWMPISPCAAEGLHEP